jgi:hypothetical protein
LGVFSLWIFYKEPVLFCNKTTDNFYALGGVISGTGCPRVKSDKRSLYSAKRMSQSKRFWWRWSQLVSK